MTNYLSVATVTAALQNIIQIGIKADLPGTTVTSVTPEGLNNAQKERKINIYLYQTSPVKELQQENSIYNHYNSKTKQKCVQLNLHYLITFYGNELELEPQQLLGSTVRTLLDRSTLEPEIIRQTISSSSFLTNSALENQIKKISFSLNTMAPEELIRIWSTLFRSPYALSISYVGKAVMIEGEKARKIALPVRNVLLNSSVKRLFIEEVKLYNETNQPITVKSNLIIKGSNFCSPNTKLSIGNVRINPRKGSVSDEKIELNLSDFDLQELQKLRPGAQSIQVLHVEKKVSIIEPVKVIESNAVSLILCPVVTEKAKLTNIRKNWNNFYSAEIFIRVDLTVDPEQRVSLLINEINNENPEAYIFAARPRQAESNILSFLIRDVKEGEYLFRVQINGAESPIEIDENPASATYGQYYKPKFFIGIAQIKDSSSNDGSDRTITQND